MPKPPRVLVVDDDQRVLDAMLRTLRGAFEPVGAVSADAARLALTTQGPFAVVVSDLRMPKTDGIAFLSYMRQVAPDCVRVLLTGFGDIEAASKAVNDGQIFRLLKKPCPSSTLIDAINAAAEHHMLLASQHELLDGTLHGCVEALADVLAIASPLAFARAQRVRESVGAFVERFGIGDRWKLEVATILSQIGAASLPPDLTEKVYFGRPLTDDERSLVARLPSHAVSVVAHVPRLDAVREILAHLGSEEGSTPPEDADESVLLGVHLLRIAFDFDVLITQGHSIHSAIGVMDERIGIYNPFVLEDFSKWQGELGRASRTLEICVAELAVGMTLATDVVDSHGVLLVAHGQRVSPRALDLVRSYFGAHCVTRKVRIRIAATGDAQDLIPASDAGAIPRSA